MLQPMNMQPSASTLLNYSGRINFNGVHTDKTLNLEHYNFIEGPWFNPPKWFHVWMLQPHEYATKCLYYTALCLLFILQFKRDAHIDNTLNLVFL